jgi:tetratricopeptide (TPR) repeat protein
MQLRRYRSRITTSWAIGKDFEQLGAFMRKFKLGLTLPFALFTALFRIPSAYAGDFELGCEQYNAKDYQQARLSFEKAVKTFPQNWLVHYYLANTYLSCKQTSSAKREYEACLSCKPNAATAKYCQDVLMKLGGSTSTSAAAPELSTPDPENKVSSNSDKTSSKPDGRAAVHEAASQAIIEADQAKADEILKKARTECQAIRAEAKDKIANGKHTGNQWYYRKDGTMFIDLLDEEKEAITKEAEERCEAIMRTAESRAKPLQH